mmetsp:Transcript_2192/g.4891  ORF Transcript_2192/g.4891 Transcript_2192/m.4891 type:complete len:217 (-) Transcript_2192:637-1287(-)
MSTARFMLPSQLCSAWMQASLSVKPMFDMAASWPLYRISGLSCSAATKSAKDSLKFAAGLFGCKPLNTAGESSASAFDFVSAGFFPAFFPAGASVSPVSDSFSTAACKEVMEVIVCEWNICPMKPASKNGSSGWSFTVGPGRVCTSCDNNCCMFASCIMDAMALVSKVPIQSGASGPRLAPSKPSASLSASSSSPPSPDICGSGLDVTLLFLTGNW